MKIFSLHKKNIQKQKGVSLVEVIVASAIIATATVALFASFALVLSSSLRNSSMLKAVFLLEEGSEAVRFMRDYSWNTNISSLSNGINYYFYWDTSLGWRATTTSSLIDSKFDRSVVFSAVNRDASGNVVSSGGSLDSDTKKATISVAWREGTATTTKNLETYVFDTFNN